MSISRKDLKSFIVYWNNRFPNDRKFRKKYNIPFNSETHRSTNQIDIFLDLLEDDMVSDQLERYQKYSKLEQEYRENGIFLIEKVEDEDEESEMFEKLRSSLKKQKVE